MSKTFQAKFKRNRRNLALFKHQIKEATVKSGGEALTKIKERLSKKGLSEAQLSALDRPYARRHGKIKSINSNPTEIVGRQSGRLLSSLKTKTTAKGSNQHAYRFSYIIFFDNPPRYAKYIFSGTRVMLPRNTLGAIENDTNRLLRKFVKSVKL